MKARIAGWKSLADGGEADIAAARAVHSTIAEEWERLGIKPSSLGDVRSSHFRR